MTVSAERLKAVFDQAAEIAQPVARAAFLDRACGGDADLRARVEALLRAHAEAGSFLEDPVVGPSANDTCELGGGPAETALHNPPELVGAMIADRYKLLQEIGEGGMGTVYMAEQTQPVRRQVALKLIKSGMDSRQVLARFEAERQALALMDHPNIAKVLDAGVTPDGRPYFVMELVKGQSITEYCDEQRLTPTQRLELFVPICQAIQHAHQKGIIHRDIKPTNVLVALYDGKPMPKVIDFGVAKAIGQPLTERTLVTGLGAVIGTPEYMSPEQASFNNLDIDTRSDVYALGVLLYELLAGSPPFSRKELEKAGILEMLRVIREQEPSKPSTKLSTAEGLPTLAANRGTEPAVLTKLVRGELDWIVMKALEKDRNRRYEAANGFAQDVQRYLANEAVQACPPSAGYRLRKFVQRNKPALAIATAAALALVMAAAGLATSNYLITREQQETVKALHDATEARDDLKRINNRERVDGYFRRISLAHAALSVDNLGQALDLLDECPEELRGWEWHYLMRFCKVDPIVIRDKKAVHSIGFSSDGERLVSADGDGAIRVWNCRTGRMVSEIEHAHRGFASSVVFHPDGNHVASVGADKQMKVWNLATNRQVFDCPCDAVPLYGTSYSVAFNPRDPDHIAAGYQGTVTVWNWRTKKSVHTFHGHMTDRISVAFSPDGRYLATGNWQGTVKLWDAVAGGGPLHTLAPTGEDRAPITALAFDPGSTRLAVASIARRVNVWEPATGRLLRAIPHPGGLVLGVAFSRDGLLASVGEDRVVRVWDVNGRDLLDLHRHAAICGCVTFSPDGTRLASADWDGMIAIWDATPLRGDERQEAASFEEHGDEVWSVAVNPTGPRIVSAGWSMPTLIWDAQTKRETARSDEHGRIVFRIAWDPDGKRFASAGSSGSEFSVKVCDGATGTELFKLLAPGRPEFFAVAFSPDRRFLVTGRGNGVVQVWDAKDGRLIGDFSTHNGPVRGVVFSPDGSHMAIVRPEREVDLWDSKWLGEKPGPQKPLHTFAGHLPSHGTNVAFSSNGKQLVMSDKNFTVKVYDVESGKELLVLRGHNGDVYAVATSCDGHWIASAGEDSSVRVWNAHTGALVRTFRGHKGLVSSLAFIDDQTLVSGSRDHTVKLWDVSKLQEDPGP